MRRNTGNGEGNVWNVVHPHAAGIDIGSREHFVAVGPDAVGPSVRAFGCATADLLEMGRWLKQHGVTTVAMESTGVYWVPVARILEADFGIAVVLVDPRYVRAVPGRKSDVQDCQWLQRLHTYGLLTGVFRSPLEIEPLKAYYRHRKSLVEGCAQHIHRMQKALEVMNVQLHKVLSDITGTTGMRIVRAIVSGERDPVVLARYRHPLVKSSADEIAKALEGKYLPEQIFVLRQSLEALDFGHALIAACDEQIEAYLRTLKTRPSRSVTCEAPAPRPTRRKKTSSKFDLRAELTRIAGVDLTRIPGIDALTAQTLLAEIGVDVSAFPTEDHFASWLALCPNHAITGGRVRRRKSRPNASRAATAFRLAAQSLQGTKTALGAFYRRLRARLGAPKAITAAARKLAVTVYRMLKHGEAFVEKGQEAYEEQYKARVLDNLRRSAKHLGFQLVAEPVS
jgi:transposase